MLVRKRAWNRATDLLRHQNVNQVVDTFGVSSAETQLSDLQAGTEDVIDSSTPVNPASIPSLIAANSPSFHIWQYSTTFPYIVFNLRSPDAGGAAGKLLVRQPGEYGADKATPAKTSRRAALL